MTNLRKQLVVVDAVVANRSRLRVSNVSGLIDVGSLLFRDQSTSLTIIKFDRNNVYMMTVNDVLENVSLA